MRNLFILLVLICVTMKSQDTIRFRNGESKAVKVSEVGLTNIHYSRFDNLDGPKYIVEKNDVSFIKYSGGQIDSFAVAKPQPLVVIEKPLEIKKKSGFECPKIVIQDKNLFCNGRPIGESRLLKMIPTVEDNAKKNRMLKAYSEMKTHKKKQYLIGFVCLGVGVGAAVDESPPPQAVKVKLSAITHAVNGVLVVRAWV